MNHNMVVASTDWGSTERNRIYLKQKTMLTNNLSILINYSRDFYLSISHPHFPHTTLGLKKKKKSTNTDSGM